MKPSASTTDSAALRFAGPWRHHDVAANGIRLHVADIGSGPLVLLLHGFPEFWWSWQKQLIALADAGYRAVAVDLRGYGDSDKPPRGYDGWTLAGDVAGLIKALGASQAHLVGHAWGGLLAWTVGAMHARLVNSLTVISAPHPLALRRMVWRDPRGQGKAASHIFRFQLPWHPERWLTNKSAAATKMLMREWSGSEWTAKPDFVEVVQRNQQAMLVPGVAHSAMEYYRWAVRSQLRTDGRRYAQAVDRRMRVPVLQIHGEQDPIILTRTARKSEPWLGPRSNFQLLPKVGHFPHHEAPVSTTDLILEFFKSL